MPRARRAWSAIKPEIRRLLRETTAAYWSDELLLDLWNQALDLRTMDLAAASEGWVTDTQTADIVSGQREYTLPEGIGRLKRVLISRDDGSGPIEVPLTRHERYQESVWHSTGTLLFGGAFPTVRLEGELLILEPLPRVSITDGLHLQFEAAPARFAGDSSKLARRLPDVLETLLIYDTVYLALGVEEAQGAIPRDPGAITRLERARIMYEGRFLEFIEVRLDAPHAAVPHYLGD